MKFFIAIFLTALLGYAAPLYFAWWSFSVSSFVVAVALHQKPGKAFVAGFFGLFLLWNIQSFIIDYLNDHLLSHKVAQMLHLGESTVTLILLTSCIGGLVSGLAALTGSFARKSAA